MTVGARLVWISVLVAILLVAPAASAIADPVAPTNYRSVVNALEPAPTGVVVSVTGGDAFLQVAVSPGHTVEISGYFGEPYLRIDQDGTVWRNEMSPARFINRDRYGLSGVPDDADASAPPEWVRVGSGGNFAWHDHRIHWMARDMPPTIAGDRAEIVFPWRLSVTIDGTPTEIRGELLWFPSVNPVGPILTGAIGILALLAWRPRRLQPLPLIAALTGALALFVAIAQYAATPAIDRGAPAAAVVPALAIVAAVLAMRLAAPTFRSLGLVGIAGITLAWWSWTAAAALTAPVLPSALPAYLERGVVSLAGWMGVAVALLAAFEFFRTVRSKPVRQQAVGPAVLERSTP